jgi:hypothetical protein
MRRQRALAQHAAERAIIIAMPRIAIRRWRVVMAFVMVRRRMRVARVAAGMRVTSAAHRRGVVRRTARTGAARVMGVSQVADRRHAAENKVQRGQRPAKSVQY